MRALQNIIQEIHYEEEEQSTQTQFKKKKTQKSFRFIKLPTKLMDYMAWKYLDQQQLYKCIHFFFQGPMVFLYIKKNLPGVFDDNKTFLVSALGLNWTNSDSRTNWHQLVHKLPGGTLFAVARWEKEVKEKKNKGTVKLLSKSWVFSFLFFFYWNKKLSNASQKAENILQY